MKPVFLHIGMPKTGTTSIQHFLKHNRGALRARGFVVPRTPGQSNHTNLALYALPERRRKKMRRANGLETVSEVMRFRELFLANFAKEAATWSQEQTVVLSSEHMSLLRKPPDFDRLKQVLAVAGNRPIRVVIYLRRQDLFYLSGYSQRIKSGASLHWSERGEQFDPSDYDYRPILECWKAAFGQENIRVRAFERTQMVNGDAVSDFLSVIGCEDQSGLELQNRRNPSLDSRTVEFARRLNAWYPRFIDGRLNRERKPWISALEQLSSGPPLRMDQESALAFLGRYEQCNASIAREYLGRDDGILFRETPGQEMEQRPVLLRDDAIEIAARLEAVAQQLDPPERSKLEGALRTLLSEMADERESRRSDLLSL